MECTRGGNDNCVDLRIVDCLVEIGVNLGACASDLGALLCTFLKYIAYSDNLCAADAVLDAFDVLAADHATADDSNFEFHFDVPPVIKTL